MMSFAVILRLPLFSENIYKTLLNAPTDTNIINILENQYFLDGLSFSSEELYYKTRRIIDNKNLPIPEKYKLKLLKYLLRSSFRCTPFGNFSSLQLTNFELGNNTRIKISNEILTIIKPSNDFETKIKLNSPLNNTSKYFLNNYIYITLDDYRFWCQIEIGYKKVWNFVRLKRNKLVDLIVSKLKIEAISKIDLINFLINNDFHPKQIQITIEELIKLGFVYINENNITTSINRFKTNLVHFNANFYFVESSIRSLNIYNQKDNVIEIIKKLRTIEQHNKIPWTKNIIHMESKREIYDFKLRKRHIYQINRAINYLSKFHSNMEYKPLQLFKDEFIFRYGHTEVPLLLTLDFIDGINYNLFKTRHDYLEDLRNKYLNILDNIILDCKLSGNFKINLEQYIEDDYNFNLKLGKSEFSIFGQFVKFKGKEYICLNSITSNLIAFLGRFTNYDKNIDKFCKEIYKIKQTNSNNTVICDIDYFNQDEISELSLHTMISENYIPLSISQPDLETLDLGKLLVGIKDDRIYLKEKDSNKIIQPNCFNAYNNSINDNVVYNFLSDISNFQNNNLLSWMWGKLRYEEHLPRITFGNVIFARETWNIDPKLLSPFKELNGEKLIYLFNKFREKYSIPINIVLNFYDNHLPLNLEHEIYIKILLSSKPKDGYITITENIFLEGEALIEDENSELYNGEFIITMESINKIINTNAD